MIRKVLLSVALVLGSIGVIATPAYASSQPVTWVVAAKPPLVGSQVPWMRFWKEIRGVWHLCWRYYPPPNYTEICVPVAAWVWAPWQNAWNPWLGYVPGYGYAPFP